MRTTNPQAISRVLKANGFTPSYAPHGKRWPGLLCTRSGDDVRVRVWKNIEDETPSDDDRETAHEIAELLESLGYIIRHETGEHFLYVAGKEK